MPQLESTTIDIGESAVLLIEPGRSKNDYWKDIWSYRELFYVLAWRDVVVRYKQTIIGVIWSLIQPLVTTAVFSLTFSKFAKLPSDGGAPYPLMVFAAILPWQLFSTALLGISVSLEGNSNLISKVYFPRLIIPTASAVVSLADFTVSLILLFGLYVWFGFIPSWQLFALPIFVIMAFFACLGPGLWIASLNAKYRDFRYVIPFIVQLGLYISPVGYSSSVVPDKWRLLYSMNPMVGVIDGFRWAILGGISELYIPGLILGLLVTIFFMIIGVSQFRKLEGSLADLI